jgi:hypothetical protein
VIDTSTSTSITSSVTAPTYGDNLTFTAVVSAVTGDTTPTGTIQFLIDGAPIGSPVSLVNGIAVSSTIANLASGPHTVDTIYSGNVAFPASSDGTFDFSVARAHLTVTANDQDIDHGDDIPSLSYVIKGFVNHDDASDVSGIPLLTTSADSSSSAGHYAINVAQGSLASNNYVFDLVPGTLTVHPHVVDVQVSWGSQSMSILGLGRDLPFSNIRAIDVIFSDDVSVDAADLSLVSAVTPSNLYPVTGFEYNPTTHRATWTLADSLGLDRLSLSLDGDATGHDGIRYAGGIYLGAYSTEFSVLPGDVNGDSRVDSLDMLASRDGILGVLDQALEVWADTDGNGKLDINDYLAIRKFVGKRF